MSLKTNTKAGSFSSLDPPISQWIVDAVTAMGFSHMTPVQANTIPLFMQNKDVVVEAVTGSGKTLSFVIPILEKVLAMERAEKKAIRAIVISPTRELATQIFEVFSSIIRCHPSSVNQLGEDSEAGAKDDSDCVRAMLLIGGTGASSIRKDMKDFRENGADILIATPGRLEEFLLGYSSISKGKQKFNSSDQSVGRHALVNLKALEMLVLDEADRLLDLGFAPVLTNVISHLPKQRRTGLFSATLLNDGLTELIKVGLRNPVKIVVKVQTNKQLLVEDDRVPSGLINYFLEVPKIEWKMSQLIRLLNQMIVPKPQGDGAHKFIVYMSTCACVDYYYKILSKLSELKNFAIYSLHAQQSPTRRSITYNSFKTSPLSKPTVLLCTDLVARGLDLPDIDVVIQYDPPKDVRNFFHRIGRTARAGRGGKAIVFLKSGRELDYIEYLKIRKIVLEPWPYVCASGESSQPRSKSHQKVRKPPTTPRTTQPTPPDNDEEASALNSVIKTIVKTDRDLHDKAVNAFVSYIRFYSNHEASYIFQLKHLDLLQLGFEGFGLIRMPKMPELKDYQGKEGPLTSEGFKKEGHDFRWNEYQYLDPIKEKNRIEKLEIEKSKPKKIEKSKLKIDKVTPLNQKLIELESKKLPNHVAWSNQINKKLNKEQKRLKRLRGEEPKLLKDGIIDLNNDEDDEKEVETDWKELVKEKRRLKKSKTEINDDDCNSKSNEKTLDGAKSNQNESRVGFFDGLLD